MGELYADSPLWLRIQRELREWGDAVSCRRIGDWWERLILYHEKWSWYKVKSMWIVKIVSVVLVSVVFFEFATKLLSLSDLTPHFGKTILQNLCLSKCVGFIIKNHYLIRTGIFNVGMFFVEIIGGGEFSGTRPSFILTAAGLFPHNG